MEGKQKLEETFQLIQIIWVVFLFALYMACFIDEYRFPGQREKPLEGEEMIWMVQNVLFFGIMGLGFLADLVQIKIDKSKAFLYLTLSLVMGGLATTVGALQFEFFKKMMGVFGMDIGA